MAATKILLPSFDHYEIHMATGGINKIAGTMGSQFMRTTMFWACFHWKNIVTSGLAGPVR
jgi:hypothetical protein